MNYFIYISIGLLWVLGAYLFFGHFLLVRTMRGMLKLMQMVQEEVREEIKKNGLDT